jgi:hypothetical protein
MAVYPTLLDDNGEVVGTFLGGQSLQFLFVLRPLLHFSDSFP